MCIKLLRIHNTHTINQKRTMAVCNSGDFWCAPLALTLYKAFCEEAVVWKRLRHPNVVPLLGVVMMPLQLVSRWMPNGTLVDFVSAKPGVNRISLVSVSPRRPITWTDFL